MVSRFSISLYDDRSPSEAGYKPRLDLLPSNGYVVQSFSSGFPEVRDVVEKRPSQNGTFDYTEFFGARGVTLMVSLAPELCTGVRAGLTDDELEQELRAWMLPSLRPVLLFSRDGGPWRRMSVRAQNVGGGLSLLRHNFLMINMAWRCPNGVVEVESLESATLFPGGVGAETGRSYDLTFDRSYPAGSPIGLQPVVNSGTAPVYPTVTFYGPMGQPRLENATTGKALEFISGFSLLAGEYLVVDFNEGTALLGGVPSNSRYDKIDFTATEWWELIPGVNNLRLYPLSSTAPASALVEYRSAFI